MKSAVASSFRFSVFPPTSLAVDHPKNKAFLRKKVEGQKSWKVPSTFHFGLSSHTSSSRWHPRHGQDNFDKKGQRMIIVKSAIGLRFRFFVFTPPSLAVKSLLNQKPSQEKVKGWKIVGSAVDAMFDPILHERIHSFQTSS